MNAQLHAKIQYNNLNLTGILEICCFKHFAQAPGYPTTCNRNSTIKTLVTQTLPEILETISEQFGQA